MTNRKKTTGKAKRLKLKKETLKDLDVKGKDKDVKGGYTGAAASACACTRTCYCVTEACRVGGL